MCEINSQLKINPPKQDQWCRSRVLIVKFEQISHIILVFPLLTLNKINTDQDIHWLVKLNIIFKKHIYKKAHWIS